ncbi:hypothetical protein SMICM17S_09312 [Streptomyces microflavus]
MLDLAEFDFPVHYPERATEQMTEFAGAIGKAEAFVVVTPEYNRSFPASLKQAIDFAYDEWQTKPVGFVSYGHGSSGLYAVEQLRSVFTELHTVTLRNGVALDFLHTPLEDRAGACARDRAVRLMLDQLGWGAGPCARRGRSAPMSPDTRPRALRTLICTRPPEHRRRRTRNGFMSTELAIDHGAGEGLR